MPVIFQTSGHTKKECLKDGWLPEKIRISNILLWISTHSGDTPHGNHRLLSYSFSIAFRGAILPGLLKIAHSKIFQPQNPLEDSAYSASDAFIHHRAKHDFKKIERCQHGPIPGQNERINGAGKQTLRLSICTQYRYWCRHLQCIFILAPKFVRP